MTQRASGHLSCLGHLQAAGFGGSHRSFLSLALPGKAGKNRDNACHLVKSSIQHKTLARICVLFVCSCCVA